MKTCIITGANSGIGRSAAEQIAAKGWRVILACRNMPATDKAYAQIKEAAHHNEVYPMKVDLSLMAEVRAFAGEFTERFGELDVLINNAADFDISRKTARITKEGNEVQFATNVLAPFLLADRLMPLLKKSPDGRIINISSQGLMLYPNIKFDFENVKGDKKYSPAKTYYQNKLGLLMNSLKLKDQLQDSVVSVHAVRVTNVKIDIGRYPDISAAMKFMYRIKSKFSISPDEMAKVYTDLAAGEKRSGFLYDEKMQEVSANKSAYDPADQNRLWEICQRLTR